MADPGFEVGLAVDKAKCGPNRRAVAHEQRILIGQSPRPTPAWAKLH